MENKPIQDVKSKETFKYYRSNFKTYTFIKIPESNIRFIVGNFDVVFYKYENSSIIHRLDGPAIITDKNEKFWHINGRNVTYNIKKWAIDNEIDLDNLTNEDKALIKLIWADYGE